MAAAPRAVRREGAPSRISTAATIGMRTIRLSMRSRAENHEVDQRDHADAEEQRIPLEIAELEKPKDKPQAPHRAAARTNEDSIDDPFVDEGAQSGEHLLRASDQRGI